ncbi:hypothetical protein D3C81_702760 [compost metagenome]
MPRHLVQGLAFLRAALLLGGGEGVVGGQRDGLGDVPVQGRFNATHLRFIDVDPVTDELVRGTADLALARGIAGAVGAAAGLGDLVLEVGVEQGQAGGETFEVVPDEADFLAQALLRLEAGVTDDDCRVATATGDLAPVIHGGADVRRAITTGYATLDGPLLGRVIDPVQAWRPVGAVVLVAVHAQAAGQGEGFGQAPFVFGKQCPRPAGQLVDAGRRGQLVALVAEVFVFVLATESGDVRIAEERHLRIEHGVFQFHAPAGVLDLLALQVAFAGEAVPAPGMGDGEIGAVVVVATVGSARRTAFVRVALLLGLARFQGDVVVFIRGERQLGRGAVGALLVEAVDDMVFVAARTLAVQLQADQVVDQRPGDEGIGAVVVARVGAVLEGRFGADAAVPLRGNLAGDDVDHPAHGVGAVQRRHRPAHHFDTFDSFQRWHPALLDTGAVTVRASGTRVLAFAVDQHQRVLGGHAANADVAGAGATGDHHARHIAQGIGDVTVGFVLDLLAGNDRNRRRRILDLLGETRRGHHHVVQLQRLGLGSGVRGVQRAEGEREAGFAESRGHEDLSLRNVKVA